VQWSPVGSTNVKVVMRQSTSHASVTFFEMPVALKFKNATKEKTVVVNNTYNGQSFMEDIGFLADTVLVDPEYWIISKNNSTQKSALANTGTGMVDIYPNPVKSPLTVFLHDFEPIGADIRISNATGQLMYKKQITLTYGAELVEIPTSHWARGIYVVTVQAAGKKWVKQVIN
jgi:hypothetical protein